jgi:hypothetical protein
VISFYHKRSGTLTEKFRVGYSTTDEAVGSFIWGSEVSNTSPSTWALRNDTFPANAKYIAINYTSNWAYRLYIDDIRVSELLYIENSNIQDGDVDVAITKSSIVLTFNRNIPASDLSGISLLRNNAPVAATTTISGKVLTIAPITYGSYKLTIPKGTIADLDNEYVLSFTTQVKPIQLVSTSPADEATGVAINAPLKVNLDTYPEINAAANFSGVTVKTTTGGAAVAGVSVSYDAPNGASLTIAHANFAFSTSYTVTVPKASIYGLTDEIVWSFTTRAATPLTVKTYSPANGATNVFLNEQASVTFDKSPSINAEPVLSGITIKDATNVAVANISAISNPLSNKISINHATLERGKTYTVTIPAGAIPGYTPAITWSFSTLLWTGLNDVKVSSSVYPTVTEGLVTVTTPGESTVKVADLSGRLLATYKSTGELPIQLTYANGVYFVIVESGKAITTYKVILKK